MTVHAHGRRLQCHHCGYRQAAPLACPDCASLALQTAGHRHRTHRGVPRREIHRRAGGAHRPRQHPPPRRAAEAFRRTRRAPRHPRRHADAGQGHDLPNLTLVGVVGIDEGLFSADFRASEKLAQLLVQVAGRAGRAERAGTVLLQTHHPDHPLLQILVNGGYHAFAEAELGLREAAGFPPFAHLALLRAEGRHAEPRCNSSPPRSAFIFSPSPASGEGAEGGWGQTLIELHGPTTAGAADAAPRRLASFAIAVVLARAPRAARRARHRRSAAPRIAGGAQAALVAGRGSGGFVLTDQRLLSH